MDVVDYFRLGFAPSKILQYDLMDYAAWSSSTRFESTQRIMNRPALEGMKRMEKTEL